MGFNMGKAKEKMNKSKSTKESLKQTKLKHQHKMDYINSSITVINSLADLTNTIFTAKEETKRVHLQSKNRQAELTQELELLKVKLEEKRKK